MKHKVIAARSYHGTPERLSITGTRLEAVSAAVPSTSGSQHQLLPAPSTATTRAFGRWAADRSPSRSRTRARDGRRVLEPVQNAGGCFPPPPGYFQRVREICDQYDVLLVSDEVRNALLARQNPIFFP
jgi:adenosylmethionine-8-amino-7-oxononanoate aminotransferase